MTAERRAKVRVGVLSALGAPYLGHFLAAFEREAVPVAAAILDSREPSAKDRAIEAERTRGRLPPIPLHRFDHLRIPFYFVGDHTSAASVALVRALRLDLLVNAGTPRILKAEILAAPRIGTLNCHPGVLPEFRGCTCVEWAVYLDRQIGNTTYFMTKGIDEGPIVLAEGLRFRKTDDYADVRVAVYRHRFDLLARGTRMVIDEDLTPASLPPQGEGHYHRVIEPEKMDVVLDKLRRGAYAYQLD